MSTRAERAAGLVVLPQREELAPLLRHLDRRGHSSSALQLGHVSCFQVPSLQLVLAIGGHGKAQLGIQTQYLIDRMNG